MRLNDRHTSADTETKSQPSGLMLAHLKKRKKTIARKTGVELVRFCAVPSLGHPKSRTTNLNNLRHSVQWNKTPSQYRSCIFTRSSRSISSTSLIDLWKFQRPRQSRRFGMCGSRKLSRKQFGKQFLNRNKNNSLNNSETIHRTIRIGNCWSHQNRLRKRVVGDTRKRG